jgi:hypothetical protein
VRFWDASGLVPLLVEEAHSKACRKLLRSDPRIVVWTSTRTDVTAAERRLDALACKWAEIDALLLVREQAERLLRVHALRAADALQLAAAVIAVDHRPRGRPFVCLDDRLGLAADAEGFDVVHPTNA